MKELKTFVRENTDDWPVGGWGNGYVLIPEGHYLHGRHHEDISVDIHGCLNFSAQVDEGIKKWGRLDIEYEGAWIVGFDTCHFGDTLDKWPKERVEEETINLKKQLIALTEKETNNER